MNAYLTGNQVQLLKKSFRQLNAQAYSDHFYSTLFARHPELRHLFPADLSNLKIKLMSAFELVMFSFEEKLSGQYSLQDALIIPLRHLGTTHEEKGVQPVHYLIANGLMLETLAHVLGPQHTEEISQAWSLALGHLTSAMLNKSVKVSNSWSNDTGSSLRETFQNILQKIKR